MDSYKLLLFLHIAAATVGLGLTFAYPFLQAAAERSGVVATRFLLQATLRIEKIAVVPGAVIVLLMGVGLIFDDGTGYKDDFPTWLMIAIPWYLAIFAVAILVQSKNVAKAIGALEGVPDNAPLPAAYVALGKKIQMVGGLLGLSIIGILFLMVWKPGQ